MSYNYKGISNQVKLRSKVFVPYVHWVNAFTEEELKLIETLMDETPLDTAMISSIANDKAEGLVDSRARTSKVSFHNPNEKNNWIFERFNMVIDNLNTKFYNFDINGYDGFQYAEYHGDELGKYEWHTDMYIGEMPYDEEHRKLSLVMLLNEPDVDFEGGDFELIQSSLTSPEKINLSRGKIIVFPSFLFHRVTPVLKGVRKSIVIWTLGPKFR